MCVIPLSMTQVTQVSRISSGDWLFLDLHGISEAWDDLKISQCTCHLNPLPHWGLLGELTFTASEIP